MKGLKAAIKYQIKEIKEMAKNPWFWVFYVIVVFLMNYFDIK
jgi:hypothetical protein